MAGAYLNIISFLITTVFYYLSLKPQINSSAFSDKNSQEYIDYKGNQYLYLGIYFLLVMVVQFGVNTTIITSNCGGNVSDNIGFAGFITFIPWTLIFGVTLLVLIIYPGFKSAFADVIGYFYVSTAANKIITELLVSKDLENSLGNNANTGSGPITDPNIVPNTDSGTGLSQAKTETMNVNVIEDSLENDLTPTAPELPSDYKPMFGGQSVNKKELEKAADAIIKICGNSSILINQMVPENFDDYWKILNPLKKPIYQDDSNPKTQEMKNELFELVSIRDNIGEAMWYIYTGLLLISITQMKIASRGCVNSQATMEKNYQQFLENEKQAQEAKANAKQTYTIT
uniref:Uncharacterized protein n=1 Tax=viral metagenome TaxID=1070528 RepID=A0A6C0II85_9ZZZZ